LKKLLTDYECNEFLKLIEDVIESVYNKENSKGYAKRIGLEKGISGYMYHTVPMVIHAWLSFKGDFRRSIIEMIECGGDTDTTAAILGSILGANVKEAGSPKICKETYIYSHIH